MWVGPTGAQRWLVFVQTRKGHELSRENGRREREIRRGIKIVSLNSGPSGDVSSGFRNMVRNKLSWATAGEWVDNLLLASPRQELGETPVPSGFLIKP